ncbi:heptaprenyl diphosphate synthase [Amycolatopsis bartoniae]|uniref:Geranylgeranyl pyrophosphate synthase n=1 Tax=Amycolatopsis bartoniae TaxID=941986 RepID=A0A8H9M794_9PSEU|nr:polyprenyl synthetase family protein [Amycolatopsis bartoniae]MBB2933706.1 heptaprenyl diphosphate synthase [Amycolatopsis bartoniae]TVT10621.1 polyprenyl synthetase family protein [Amycolatopsis bartoniae]GHF72179.1 geranylgeranyl pyrophosphate synthase [Amycolatopsis bartoniae]
MSVQGGTIEDLRASVGLRIADEQLLRTLAGGLADVENLLRETARSEVKAVHDAASHLVEAGGKRFRPMFTLLAAEFGEGNHDGVVTAAAAVELVHLATLYHDDVMDEATMRRGAQSVNARWDNTVAILTGDFLFAHASRLVSYLGTDAARIIAETFGELVTGQMRETVGPADGEDPVEHYLSVIAQKTGSLIATSGRFGGMISGAKPEYVSALTRFGDIIGTAFQISDDIIDIASPSDESGKTPGTDLREGVRTLPMLYALADPASDPRLLELLAGPIAEDELVDEALRLLRVSSGLDRAMATLSDYARRARVELSALPACPARDACESVADYLVARTR